MEEEDLSSGRWTREGAREEKRKGGWKWEETREWATAGIQLESEEIVINKKIN